MKFRCESGSLDDYLEETEVVDYNHFSIKDIAAELYSQS